MPYKAVVNRGIRTLKEVAHFVRCIPMMAGISKTDEFDSIWSSPDIMLTRNAG